MSGVRLTRRTALQSLAGASLVYGQTPPVADLANVFEMRDVARRKLSDEVYSTIAGTDRRAMDRITFRPRLMVNVSKLDLSLSKSVWASRASRSTSLASVSTAACQPAG